MKTKMGIVLLMIFTSSAYAIGEKYEGPAHYRIFETQEIVDPIEKGAYENFLRLVDEQNRQNGNSTNYLEKAQYKAQTEFDHVNFIPVAQFTGSEDKYKEELNSKKISSISGLSSVHEIIEGKEQGLRNKGFFEKLSYSREGNTKRFFFGKGNQAKDIIITGSDSFDEAVKEASKTKKSLYVLEGSYERPKAREKNQLSLSLEEHEGLKRKTREEQLEFLSKKMSQTFSKEIISKNGDLYTKDQNGKEWKVLWTLEPISESEISYGTDKKYYKDDIFTNIFLYVATKGKEDKTDSSGRIFYSKDKDIILEDKYSYGEVISIPKKIQEQYETDKKELSSEEFKQKWILPFQEGGEFSQQMEGMKRELEEVQKQKEELDKRKEAAERTVLSMKYSFEAPENFVLGYLWERDPQKKEYVKALTKEKDKEFMKKLLEQETIVRESDSGVLIEKVQKKYGFYQGPDASSEERKWAERVIENKEILKKYLGKNIEFRGQGRIDGVIDLGEGSNQLTIAEQFTGKYGTNIILGPYAKLKNISFVNISGAIGGGSKASLSGRTSLSLDIDSKVKNAEGHLVQHALKDSDKTIVFRSPDYILGSDNRNDFSMELMASRISEDSIVDMERNLNYNTQDFQDPAKEIQMKVNVISDSIAHSISEKDEKSKEGNTLLEIQVKDRLKKLEDSENKVYASIKNAKKIDVLQPTLTTTNKRTLFQVADDNREERKERELIYAIRTGTAKEVLEKNSQFYFDPKNEKKAIVKIEEIAKSPKMEGLKKKVSEWKQLKNSEEYKTLALEKKKQRLDEIESDTMWQSLSQNTYDEASVQKELQKIKVILETMDEKRISQLASNYPSMEKLSSIASSIEDLKENIKKNPTDKKERQRIFSEISSLKASLKEQVEISEENLDGEFAKTLGSYYSNIQRDYFELKDMIFYSIREEEAFSELKNMLSQLKDRNIYSKVNKIAKEEISTYTTLPFNIERSLIEKQKYARGGFISARNVQTNFKGNIYTAYGIYEQEYQPGLRLGLMVGGSNTNHTETYSRTLKTVATESNIEGVSAYAGVYADKALGPNLEWITGLGLQYGFYTVKRQMKNHYQTLDSKGRANLAGINTYTGVVYSYPLPDDLILRGKGILSYTLLEQAKISEKNGLNLEIASQKYQYVDGELGLSLAKTLYDDSKRSTLSGGISGIFGLSGYKNEDLKARVKSSSSEFNIVGDTIKKDAVKIHLDYNMQLDTGLNYGLEGTYITNKDQSDVKIGLKAGYRF